MIIALTMLAAASGPTALDAERSFAADAQRIGQWSAFRKYADEDAVMFTPQAQWARDFLRGRADPPRSISWRTAASYVSCDGRTTVNTGPWFGVGGHAGGSFTTVWQRTARGWKWVYDGGTPLRTTAPRVPIVHRAGCNGRRAGAPIASPPPLSNSTAQRAKADNGRGESADHTLGWDWQVNATGTRRFRLFQWDGSRYRQVLTRETHAR